MSDNWEFALDHVKAGWVTFLGDDDGLLPFALKRIAEVIKTTNCKAVSSAWCHYTWPHDNLPEPGQLTIPIKKGVEIRNCEKWLMKLQTGEATYPELAWLYTGGFADINIIDNCKNSGGTFFRSRCPDVYSALAITSRLDKYAFVRDPVSIAGVSGKSNGAACLGISKNLDIRREFHDDSNIPFHTSLGDGKVPSIRLHVYESSMQLAECYPEFPKWPLKQQIRLAIAEASLVHRDEVVRYCKKLIESNSSRTDFPSQMSMFLQRIHFIILKARRIFNNISINTKILGADNIRDVVILATAITSSIYQAKVFRVSRFIQAFHQLKKYFSI
jgi:hypothetical protein